MTMPERQAGGLMCGFGGDGDGSRPWDDAWIRHGQRRELNNHEPGRVFQSSATKLWVGQARPNGQWIACRSLIGVLQTRYGIDLLTVQLSANPMQ